MTTPCIQSLVSFRVKVSVIVAIYPVTDNLRKKNQVILPRRGMGWGGNESVNMLAKEYLQSFTTVDDLSRKPGEFDNSEKKEKRYSLFNRICLMMIYQSATRAE